MPDLNRTQIDPLNVAGACRDHAQSDTLESPSISTTLPAPRQCRTAIGAHRRVPQGARSDKTHSEHNESAFGRMRPKSAAEGECWGEDEAERFIKCSAGAAAFAFMAAAIVVAMLISLWGWF